MKKVSIVGTNISPKQWSNLILELNLIRKQWAPYAKFEIQGPGVRKILKMAQIRQALILSKTWRSSVPVYSRILGQIFFSVIKKIWVAQVAQWSKSIKSLVLANNRCAKTLISVGTAWHSQFKLFCKYGFSQMYSARETLFVFMKTFLPKYSTYSIRSHA